MDSWSVHTMPLLLHISVLSGVLDGGLVGKGWTFSFVTTKRDDKIRDGSDAEAGQVMYRQLRACNTSPHA